MFLSLRSTIMEASFKRFKVVKLKTAIVIPTMNLPNWKYLNLGKHLSTRVIRDSSSRRTWNHLRWTLLSTELQLLSWFSEVSSVFTSRLLRRRESYNFFLFFFPASEIKVTLYEIKRDRGDRRIMVFIDYLRSSSGEENRISENRSRFRWDRWGMKRSVKIGFHIRFRKCFQKCCRSSHWNFQTASRQQWDIKARWFIVLYIVHVDSRELFI